MAPRSLAIMLPIPPHMALWNLHRTGEFCPWRKSPSTRNPTMQFPDSIFTIIVRSDFARSLKPSARGELEITDLHQVYLSHEALHVELLGRGTAWLDTGTHRSLLEAAEYIHVIESRQGLKIACLEEIAWRQGWLDRSGLERQADRHGKSSYGTYLRRLIDDELGVGEVDG